MQEKAKKRSAKCAAFALAAVLALSAGQAKAYEKWSEYAERRKAAEAICGTLWRDAESDRCLSFAHDGVIRLFINGMRKTGSYKIVGNGTLIIDPFDGWPYNLRWEITIEGEEMILTAPDGDVIRVVGDR